MTGGERNDAGAAWAAASEAVRLVMGAAPPSSAGVLRGGVRCDQPTAWRRQLAIYTAAVSLNAGVKPLVEHVGVERRMVRKILRELEDRRDSASIDQLLDLLAAEAGRQLARAERQGRAA